MKHLFGTTAAFIAVVITGGAWIGYARGYSPGEPGLLIGAIGAAFSITFLWLLIQRLRRLLADPKRKWLELLLLGVNFSVLVLVFAWIHSQIGLMDMSGPAPTGTRSYSDALYFSIITITTVGYGDFIPMGPGRIIAAMQGLVGYIILGILVSTGFQLLAPDEEPRMDDEDEHAHGPGTEEERGRDEPERQRRPA